MAKRLGTALRKLSTESKKKGVTLGGRGYGKLTQATITKLTAYYGKAIRAQRGNLKAMTDAVFATPAPLTTTCSMTGVLMMWTVGVFTRECRPLVRHPVVTATMPERHCRLVAPHVKEVYVRLGHPSLLGRCVRGETQNANESLYAKIWAKCPKTGFVGLERWTASTCSAIAEFNSDVELSIRTLCEAMDIVSGNQQPAKKADVQRLKQSLRQAQASTKEAWRARKVARAAKHDSSTGYAQGAF